MVDRIKLITARRGYVFRLDDIRLSILSTGQVPSTIQQHFDFQAASIGTPPATFGEVLLTNPPGLAFNLGSVQSSEGASVPIRFLHFEPQRIVIDVAGPSFALDQVFEQLQNLLGEVETPDGVPVLGEPTDTLNYSEVSARLGFEFSELISGPLLEIAQQAFAEDEEGIRAFPVNIMFHVEESSAAIGQPAAGQAIQVRAGTRVDERIYFSATGLTTDENLAWLETLDQRINPG